MHNNCEWTSAITNTLENASSGVTRHISEHFFAGEINIGGRPLSQMFQKGLSYKELPCVLGRVKGLSEHQRKEQDK